MKSQTEDATHRKLFAWWRPQDKFASRPQVKGFPVDHIVVDQVEGFGEVHESEAH